MAIRAAVSAGLRRLLVFAGIKSRLSGQGGYYQHFSPVFSLMTVAGRVLSLTPMELFNLWVIASQGIFTTAILVMCSRSKSRFADVTIVVLAARSDALFYLFYGYLKQGLACAPACARNGFTGVGAFQTY